MRERDRVHTAGTCSLWAERVLRGAARGALTVRAAGGTGWRDQKSSDRAEGPAGAEARGRPETAHLHVRGVGGTSRGVSLPAKEELAPAQRGTAGASRAPGSPLLPRVCLDAGSVPRRVTRCAHPRCPARPRGSSCGAGALAPERRPDCRPTADGDRGSRHCAHSSNKSAVAFVLCNEGNIFGFKGKCHRSRVEASSLWKKNADFGGEQSLKEFAVGVHFKVRFGRAHSQARPNLGAVSQCGAG